MRSLILSLVLLFSALAVSYATHYRAGEIRVVQVGDCNDLTIEATIITYTKESSFDADRQELTLCWGDGTCSVVQRFNGPLRRGESLGNDIKV
ncbi:MAG: hypothetical protein AAF849_08880, partial [Bacteroidota bacterium]